MTQITTINSKSEAIGFAFCSDFMDCYTESEAAFLASTNNIFLSYAAEFDDEGESVKFATDLKVEHTAYVRRYCRELAAHLQLPPREIFLAELGGLLHDIGRFKQFKIYRTFKDAISEDHAELGLKVIAEKGLLDELPPNERATIEFAIINHNKKIAAATEDVIKERQTKILRDADKLDIFRVLKPFFKPSDGCGVSDEFAAQFCRGEQCDYRDVKNPDESKLARLMWIYDINYAWTLERVVDAGYVDYIVNGLKINGNLDKKLVAGVERLYKYIDAKLKNDKGK